MAEAYVNIDRVTLDCPICLDRLDRPRSLPCLHTFCTNCLKAHIQITYQPRNGFTFPCPVCRSQTKPPKPFVDKQLWAEQFPVNYWIQSVMDEATKAGQNDHVPCSLHSGMRVNLFCEDHNEVLCPTCVAINHRTCDNVLEIDKLVKDFSLTTQMDKVYFTLTEREKKLRDEENRTQDRLNELSNERQHIEDTVSSKKDMLVSNIEEMYCKFNEDLDKMFGEITTELHQNDNVIHHEKAILTEINDELDSLDIEHTPVRAFVRLNQIGKNLHEKGSSIENSETAMGEQKIVHEMKNITEDIQTALSFGELRFCRRDNVNATITQSRSFDEDFEHFDDYSLECRSLESDPEPEETLDVTVMPHTRQVKAKAKTSQATQGYTSSEIVALNADYSLYNARFIDTRLRTPNEVIKPSWISSICQSRNNVHVLCDQNSSSIKLLHEGKLVFNFPRKTKPWGVCGTSDMRIAVTFPEESCIHIYETNYNKTTMKLFGKPSVTQTFKLLKTITTNRQSCYGLASLEDVLLVACESSLNVYGANGALINQISGPDISGNSFIRAMDVIVNPFTRTCYVSDEGADNVYAFDVIDFSVQRCPKFIYRNELLKSPQGLDFDTRGKVYICGFVSRNIHIITDKGQVVKILTTPQQPWTLCVDSTFNQMLISFFPDGPRDLNMFMCRMLPTLITDKRGKPVDKVTAV